ncbi:UbiA prenyltransferase family-domain-containing protein [Xylariaceae sp. FL0255]|nr:UbiA prenyltransferase family-domain-containing protein [Xylariaceae sp. FL0255]
MASKSMKGSLYEHIEEFPEYTPPTSGILSYLPSGLVPYGELARIEKPPGIYNLYFPHLFGTLFAACVKDGVTFSAFAYYNFVIFTGSIFVRSAACSWNDFADREYDKDVARCRLRPLARGALTLLQGHLLTAFCTIISLGCLYLLPENCWPISVPAILLAAIYPFAKRHTDFPQIILGASLAIGFSMGIGAIDGAFDHIKSKNSVQLHYRFAVAAFSLSIFAWNVLIDVVYAQQDVKDDEKAGIKSMAVRFQHQAKPLLAVFAIIQIASLITAGVWAEFGIAYNIVTCAISAFSLFYMLLTIDLTNPASCAKLFKSGHWILNLAGAAGLALEWLHLV